MSYKFNPFTGTFDEVAEVLEPQVEFYNSLGAIPTSVKIKYFVAVVQSDSNGNFNVDWSAAGFTQPPVNVQVTAFANAVADPEDRAWATMTIGFDTQGGSGHTLQGRIIAAVLVGGGRTINPAPNIQVHVCAIGI